MALGQSSSLGCFEMYRLLCTLLFLVITLFCLATPSLAQNNAEQPCPNNKPSTGNYRNLHHGFSIIIPAGLKGYSTSYLCNSAGDKCNCPIDHGRRIPLAIDAKIDVFAFYDPMDFEFFPPNAEHNEMLDLRREKHVSQVKRLRSGWFRLGDVKGYRYAIQFRRDKKMFVSDNVVVLFEKVVYDLRLHTSAERYETDKKLFEEILASWRWTERIERPERAGE